jgi:3-oxoadipate enol-lactonase
MRAIPALVSIALAFGVMPSGGAAQSRFVTSGDARIHYVVAGSGPAVVLVHGWALNYREWLDQIAALAPRYRVVALDRRGFGESSGFADVSADPGDIRAILDTLGIRSAVVVGHSAGVQAAYRFAAAFPDRTNGLVLYGGPPPMDFPLGRGGRGQPDTRNEIARRHGVDSVLRSVVSLPQFLPGPNRTRAMAARLDSILREYSGKDLLEDHPPSNAFAPARFDDMRQWRLPILFISGEREQPNWHVATDSMVRWLPNARKVVIPGGGHGVHFDEPEKFNVALLAFLAEIPRPR